MKEEEIAACNYVDNHLDNDGFYDAFLSGVRWQKANSEDSNCNIPDVVGRSEQLVCGHPDEALIRDKPTEYCMACGRNI